MNKETNIKKEININGSYVEYLACAIFLISFTVFGETNFIATLAAILYSFWTGLITFVLALTLAVSGKLKKRLSEKGILPRGEYMNFCRFIVILNMVLLFNLGHTIAGWLVATHLMLGAIFVFILRRG